MDKVNALCFYGVDRKRNDAMPIKHQAASYRTRNGQKYMNEGDICDATFGDLHIQAKARVQELREAGRKAFAERHQDGFYRVFVAQQKAR